MQETFDLNSMESALCEMLDFDLFVSPQQYFKEAAKLNTMIAQSREEQKARRIKDKMLRETERQKVFVRETSTLAMPKSHSQQFFSVTKPSSQESFMSDVSTFDLATLFSSEL